MRMQDKTELFDTQTRKKKLKQSYTQDIVYKRTDEPYEVSIFQSGGLLPFSNQEQQEEKIKMTEGYKVVRLLTEHIPGTLDVLRQSFFTEEKLSNCVRVLQDSEEIHTDSKYKVTKATKELEDLALDTIKDGVSLCAVDVRTNEVLGVAINKVQMKPKPGELSYFEQFVKDHVKEPSTIEFVEFMVNVDSRYDLFKDGRESYFEIMYLAVKSTANGKGIGTALVTNSAKLAQDIKWKNENKDSSIDVTTDAKEFKNSDALKAKPGCVSAIFTSRFSQKCGQRSGFTEVLKVPYAEFEYKGKKFSETIGPDHPYCTLSVKFLD